MCLCIDYILVARLDGLHLSDILILMLHFSYVSASVCILIICLHKHNLWQGRRLEPVAKTYVCRCRCTYVFSVGSRCSYVCLHTPNRLEPKATDERHPTLQASHTYVLRMSSYVCLHTPYVCLYTPNRLEPKATVEQHPTLQASHSSYQNSMKPLLRRY